MVETNRALPPSPPAWRPRAFAAAGCAAVLAGLLAGPAAAQPMLFYRFAGSPGGGGFVDGTGSAARLASALGLAIDGAGNLYVGDAGNNVVRRVSPSGAVTTFAGSGTAGSADGTGGFASFNAPYGLAFDPAGNLLVADAGNHRIRKISPSRAVTTFAGSGSIGKVDGTGWTASFDYPVGIAVDPSGTAYVADADNHLIRKISPAGAVTTFAGTGVQGYQDGPGASAKFYLPTSLVIDAGGNLIVSDYGNNRIRKISPAGVVSTFAGSGNYGGTNGTGTAASFGYPQGLALDTAGNIFVADLGMNQVRRITPAGVVSTFAGSGMVGSADGPAATASFNMPWAIAVDGAGNVFVGDNRNSAVRKITPGGTVSTLAGAGSAGFADGAGSSARFLYPWGAAADAAGNVYVADSGNHRIRKISPAGAVTTFAGSGIPGNANGAGTAAQFIFPSGVAVDGAGNVYVADTNNHAVRKITPAGTVTLLAGGTYGDAEGTGAAAKLQFPDSVAVDTSGNVYVADTDNHKIRKVTPAGVLTTLAGSGASGSADGTGSAASFNYPESLAVDASGNVYVADTSNNRIRKITPAGVVSTLAGSGFYGVSDGAGKSASFGYPAGIAVDRSGNLLVADASSRRIRQVTPGGVVSTIAGGGSDGYPDGSGPFAWFQDPAGIAVGPDGKVYVVDYSSACVRVGLPGLADVATVDAATGPVGLLRHLDVSPATGTGWEWMPIRIPSGSTAALSSTVGKSPTFTPDLPDNYVFAMGASGGGKAAISSVSLSATPAGAACSPNASTLCLLGGRFKVTAEYADYSGGHGNGKAVALTPDTGYFWFFNAANVEAIAKMVSFCGSGSNSVAIYTGGLTDLDVTLHVTDTRTGTTKDYHNPLGTGFGLIRDGPFSCPAGATGSLPGDAAPGDGQGSTASDTLAAPVPEALAPEPAPSAAGTCTMDGTTLCLLSYRFQVRATWQDYGGNTGTGKAVALTEDTGHFWFFDGRNIEAVVKMVPFCGNGSGNVAVYAGGTTDLKVTLEVKDVVTGLTKSYTNPLGTPFQLIREGPFSCP